VGWGGGEDMDCWPARQCRGAVDGPGTEPSRTRAAALVWGLTGVCNAHACITLHPSTCSRRSVAQPCQKNKQHAAALCPSSPYPHVKSDWCLAEGPATRDAFRSVFGMGSPSQSVTAAEASTPIASRRPAGLGVWSWMNVALLRDEGRRSGGCCGNNEAFGGDWGWGRRRGFDEGQNGALLQAPVCSAVLAANNQAGIPQTIARARVHTCSSCWRSPRCSRWPPSSPQLSPGMTRWPSRLQQEMSGARVGTLACWHVCSGDDAFEASQHATNRPSRPTQVLVGVFSCGVAWAAPPHT
jgi:hypothetical protein